MEYRVFATEPQPPARGVAWVGGISALALAVSPFFMWWFFDAGFGLSIGGQPAPQLISDHVGKDLLLGRLMIYFGIVCVLIWLRYSRNGWRRSPAALLLILLPLIGTTAISALLGYAVIQRDGLPMLDEDAFIAPGMYLALGTSLIQGLCLLRLVREGRR
jgi:hypothetical protein